MRISFIGKVTRIQKATTAENDTSLCPPFWVCFLNLIPVDRVEISHTNRQQNSSRLPGSYEEAIDFRVFHELTKIAKYTDLQSISSANLLAKINNKLINLQFQTKKNKCYWTKNWAPCINA